MVKLLATATNTEVKDAEAMSACSPESVLDSLVSRVAVSAAGGGEPRCQTS